MILVDVVDVKIFYCQKEGIIIVIITVRVVTVFLKLMIVVRGHVFSINMAIAAMRFIGFP